MQTDVVLNLEISASNPVYAGCDVTKRKEGKQNLKMDDEVAQRIVTRNIEELLMRQLDELPRFPYPSITIEEEDAPSFVKQWALVWVTSVALDRRAFKDVRIVERNGRTRILDIGRPAYRLRNGKRFSNCSANPRSSRPMLAEAGSR